MKFIPALLLAGFVLSATAYSAEYRILNRFPIAGDAGGYDYLRVDPAARRIYVAHEKHVEVLDADSGKAIGQVGPTVRAHGVALVPELNHGFATSGIDDQVTMFDLKTLATLKQVK